MGKIIDLETVVNVVCQDCNGCDYIDCPYDCDFINVIRGLGKELVICKDCYCFKDGYCSYYNTTKSETGYCNAGYIIKEK